MGCWDKITAVHADLVKYLEAKTGVKYDPETKHGREDYLKAVKELKQQTAEDLASVHTQIGNNKFEKTASEPKAKEVVPQSTQTGNVVKKKGEGLFAKATGIESLNEPEDVVMQHFSSGGKINPNAVKELFGENGKERNARIGLLSSKAGSIDALAHKLWESQPEGLSHTTMDYKEAIENVMQRHNSPASMAKELVEKYVDKAIDQDLTKEEAGKINKGMKDAVLQHIDHLPEETQHDLLKVIKKYQNQYGLVDWQKLGDDTNGFNADILSLPTDTIKALDEIVQKNISTGQSELGNTTTQSSGEKSQSQPAIGKYEAKARAIAGKIKSTEVLPDWLKADLPNGTKTGGLDAEGLKNALSEAVIKVGKLLDKGVELKAAIKQAADDFIDYYKKGISAKDLKPDFEKKLRDGFESFYNENSGEKQPPQEPPKQEGGEVGDEKMMGISHESLKNVAAKIGLDEPQRGTFLSPADQVERGRQLIKAGANWQEVADNFKADKKVNADIISVARAHFEDLLKAAEKARMDFGIKSDQFKAAIDEANKWGKEVVKPMGTASGGAMSSLQGETGLDTGSFVSVSRAVEDATGKPLSDKQAKVVEELTNKVKEQNKVIEDLQKKFAENIDANINADKTKQSSKDPKQQNKDTAKKIIDRNKKNKNDDADLIFQSAKRDYVAARVAKAVADGGTIEKAVDEIAKEGFIKPENVEKAKAYFNDLVAEEKQPLTAEEKNIKRLEKQLADLKAGIKKEKPDEREKSQKEIDLETEIQAEKDKQLVIKFADKTDSNFTPEEVKDIWEYAKRNYVDKGKTVNEIIRGLVADLGLSSKQVLDALEQPKGSKVISDKMFAMQNRRGQVQNKVKEYVQTINTPKWVKWLKAVPNFFFQKAIFGHGTVGMITHAGMNVFDPKVAKIYWPHFFKQFKNSFGSLSKNGDAEYEKNMMHLKNNPLFITAKRAGLKVDPTETNDDYQALKKWMGKVGMLGDRGFNTIKQFRMAYFENEYNNLSEAEKADPETLKKIAQIINHGTGTSDFKPGGFLSTALFAPRLVASQWARIIIDPAKALGTFANWKNASLADKAGAKLVARKNVRIFATYLGGLAVNQALLYATGSNQSVNFTDPTKKDWLKFKVDDKNIDLSGGIIPTVQFVGHLLYLPFESRQELGTKEHRNRIDAFGKTGSDYVLGKASPFISTGKDIVTAHDYMGNTMPWSDDKPKNKYAHKLTWKEYIFTEQAPIPMAEGAKDIYKSMQDKGMAEAQINDVLTGIMKGVITGATGVKLGEDYSVEDKGVSGGGGGASGGFKPPTPTFLKPPTPLHR